MPKKVITFTIHQYKLAADMQLVKQLQFATKTSSIRDGGTTVSLGRYQSENQNYTAIELFRPILNDSKAALLHFDLTKVNLALAAHSISQIHDVQELQALPTYHHSEISTLFTHCFVYADDIYYLLDPQRLLTHAPTGSANPTTQSVNENITTQTRFNTSGSHWLIYLLTLAQSQLLTGQLQLLQSGVLIGFTAGYPAYAVCDELHGLSALQAISDRDWDQSKWISQETTHANNVDSEFNELIQTLRPAIQHT